MAQLFWPKCFQLFLPTYVAISCSLNENEDKASFENISMRLKLNEPKTVKNKWQIERKTKKKQCLKRKWRNKSNLKDEFVEQIQKRKQDWYPNTFVELTFDKQRLDINKHLPTIK